MNTPISPTGDVTVLHLVIALAIVAFAFIGFAIVRSRDIKNVQ